MTLPDHAQQAVGLMVRIAQGEQAALGRLIQLYGRGLQIVAARYLGDSALAEEVVQDTFLRAWNNAARYDPARGTPSTWLFRIAINLCIDRQRRRRFSRFFGLELVEDRALAEDPGAERDLAGRQTLGLVRQQIEALPDRQRLALLLNAVAGMGAAEIATVMDSSTGSVEQLLVRARRTLREKVPGAHEER